MGIFTLVIGIITYIRLISCIWTSEERGPTAESSTDEEFYCTVVHDELLSYDLTTELHKQIVLVHAFAVPSFLHKCSTLHILTTATARK